MSSSLYDRLKTQWEAERKPGYVILGTEMYRVATPNGEDEPVFTPTGGGDALYGSVSWKADAPAPVRKTTVVSAADTSSVIETSQADINEQPTSKPKSRSGKRS